MNVVIDTNVLVSAIGFGGKPKEVIDLVRKKRVIGFLLSFTLVELRKILREKLKLNEVEVGQIIRLLYRRFSVIQTTETFPTETRDSKDNHILAVTHQVVIDYIISGDKDLLILNEYKKVPIVTPADFLIFYATNKEN